MQACFSGGGVIRIVVPDLENICREYLSILDNVRRDPSYQKKYEYIVIALIDQMTRQHSGGEMLAYWESDERDEEYILKRTGYPEDYLEERENRRHSAQHNKIPAKNTL